MKIVIAGAGLIGRLLAWRLLRAGHTVTLCDRDDRSAQGAAARIAAAMIAPFSEVVTGEREIFDWGLSALERWPQLLAELQAETGQEVYFQRRGSVVVAHGADRGDLQHFQQQLQRYVPDHLDAVRRLDRPALQQLEPALAERFDGGLYLEQEGTLDNRELLAALAAVIDARGAEWLGAEVACVAPGRVTLAGGEVLSCDLAIDARGFGGKAQLPTLRGVRGEVLWVHAPEVDLSRPVRLMHPRYQLYIAPKRGQLFVIGATQIESESLAPITVRSSLELQSALYSVHTGFAEAEVREAVAGCRPAFPDNLPRIDVAPGLLRVNGLFRHGYLLSPFVLDTALAVIDGDTASPIVSEVER